MTVIVPTDESLLKGWTITRTGRMFSVFASMLLLSISSLHAKEEVFSVVLTDGTKVGSLVAKHEGDNISVVYGYKNNGRGPDSTEQLVLDENGFPKDWKIDFSGLGGAKSQEQFALDGNQARWEMDGEKSSTTVAANRLYVAARTSPWTLGFYARLLLKSPGQSLGTISGGRLSLEKIGSFTVSNRTITGYALIDQDMQRQVIFLEDDGDLFATSDGVILSDYEKFSGEIRTVARNIEEEYYIDLKKKLARHFDVPVRIQNVRIFDPETRKLGELQSVTFFRDQITGIYSPNEPVDEEEVLIDGAGGTLVPGLHDMHTHTSAFKSLYPLSIAAGITTFREMGASDAKQLLREMKNIDTGQIIGPRILPSGFIEGASPFSARYDYVVSSEEEALEAVRWYARRGYIQVKLYNSINPDWVPAIAAEAHRLGLRVTGHIPAFSSPDQMMTAGFDEVTHINQLMMGWLAKPGEDMRTMLRVSALDRAANLDLKRKDVRKSIALMKSKGLALDTSLGIMERVILTRTNQTQPGDRAIMDHLPSKMRHMRTEAVLPVKTEEEDLAYQNAFKKLLETVGLIYRSGIQILPGTDFFDGFPLLRELELYVQAGLTPAEALETATLGSAKYLGHGDQWGSIEKGKSADFFLVDGDPTKDIRLLHKNRMTVARGVVYFPPEIHKEFGIRPFATPPAVTCPEQVDCKLN